MNPKQICPECGGPLLFSQITHNVEHGVPCQFQCYNVECGFVAQWRYVPAHVFNQAAEFLYPIVKLEPAYDA